MTEDEAFIRAVVDGPGDDTPRLVYADWLDDRADPRGPYLRAEREAVVTGDIARLREVAAGLDPVWVARVSLPPVGVCLEVVEIAGRGTRVSRSDVAEAERRLGFSFPADYHAFLLNYNGGGIEVGGFDTPHGAIHTLTYSFLPLDAAVPADAGRDGVELHPDPAADEWFSRFHLVGYDPDVIFGVLLGVRGVERGTITHYDFSSDWSPEYDRRPYRPAYRSFAEYLASIQRTL